MRLNLPKSRERLRRDAARWFARLQSGDDANVEQSFRRWYDEDPSHAEAFDRVRRSYEQAGLLRYSSPAWSDQAKPARQNRRFEPQYAIAAAIALLILIAASLFLMGGAFAPEATDAVMLTTRVGEIRQVRLADGSKITLDTSTRIELDTSPSHRRAIVRYGRARFELADAAAPLIIEAGRTLAIASKGTVDVEQLDHESTVELLSGSAELQDVGGAAIRHLSAGVAVTSTGGQIRQRAVRALHPDWTSGMLNFDGTELETAIALANRYSQTKIILGPGLASLRVTGAFRAGDTARLAKALQAAFHLSLERTSDDELLLSEKSNSGLIAAQPLPSFPTAHD